MNLCKYWLRCTGTNMQNLGEPFPYFFIQLSNALNWSIRCMAKLSWKNEHFAPKHITCVTMDLTSLVMNTEHARPAEVGQAMHPSVNVSEVFRLITAWWVLPIFVGASLTIFVYLVTKERLEDETAFSIYQKINRIRQIAGQLEHQSSIADALEMISINVAHGRLQAGIVGLLKSRKSTTLNALMKTRILPEAVQAETAAEVRIIHSTLRYFPGLCWVPAG